MEISAREAITPFAQSKVAVAIRELLLTLTGYAVSLALIFYGFTHGIWWLYVVACLIAALFMIKVFTLQHDCGHDSFFDSTRANTWIGRLLSIITTMPFTAWKVEHAIHHSHVVDIDKIHHGDIHLLTVTQYKNLSPLKRLGYRIFRNPLFLLVFTPFLYFFLKSKFPAIWDRTSILSVVFTNLFVVLLYGSAVWFLSFWTTVFIFTPAAYLGGIIGIALFYIQHDYPGVEWFQSHDWDHEQAALNGSSLLLLPQPFEWFTHAIGFHHIHHLNSHIPGYELRNCYEHTPAMQVVRPLTVADIITAFKMKLWSQQKKALVTFSEVHELHS